MTTTAPYLSVENLSVHFAVPRPGFFNGHATLRAVDDVSFTIRQGETVGLVGESGCGKSTLSRSILQLVRATNGRIVWQGEDLCTLDRNEMARRRKDIQIIFQDPLASLNPRMTIGEIISEPLKSFFPEMTAKKRDDEVAGMMAKVGLVQSMINRYPHEFSGGQCQRIGIARALICKPKLLICDEPVSALDVSIQAQIINLLSTLQKELDLTLLFVSHDLSIVRHICQRVIVLYMGRIMEVASSEHLFSKPQHPYTQALISAAPIPDPESERKRQRILLSGDLPSPLKPPAGCVFCTRCPRVMERCHRESPVLQGNPVDGNQVACHTPITYTHQNS